jgi:hypothetical protein
LPRRTEGTNEKARSPYYGERALFTHKNCDKRLVEQTHPGSPRRGQGRTTRDVGDIDHSQRVAFASPNVKLNEGRFTEFPEVLPTRYRRSLEKCADRGESQTPQARRTVRMRRSKTLARLCRRSQSPPAIEPPLNAAEDEAVNRPSNQDDHRHDCQNHAHIVIVAAHHQ